MCAYVLCIPKSENNIPKLKKIYILIFHVGCIYILVKKQLRLNWQRES